MSRLLTPEDVSKKIRVGKSIRCGDTWYTVEKYSKTKQALLLVTSPWETSKGKKQEGNIITFDELMKHVNEGSWLVKIDGEPVGLNAQEKEMKLYERILKNSDAEFKYDIKPIPSGFAKDKKIPQLAKKIYNLFLNSEADKAFDVAIGYVKPTEARGYVRQSKTFLRKREGDDIADKALDGGVVALQISNMDGGPVVVITEDGTIYVDKFSRDGSSRGFDRYEDFNSAKIAITRLRSNLLAWAKKAGMTEAGPSRLGTGRGPRDGSGRRRRNATGPRSKTGACPYTKESVDEDKEEVMSIGREVREAILTEDLFRRRYRQLSEGNLDEMGAEWADDEDKDTTDVSGEEDTATTDDEKGVDDYDDYKEDILRTNPRGLAYDQKIAMRDDPALSAEYERIWGVLPQSIPGEA